MSLVLIGVDAQAYQRQWRDRSGLPVVVTIQVESPEAFFQTARAYETGVGVAKMPEVAVALYEEGAKPLGGLDLNSAGSALHYAAASAVRLGTLYEEGKLVERDRAKALEWYEKAGDLRRNALTSANVEARLRLGKIHYREGRYAEALKWLRAGAPMGTAEMKAAAYRMLAEMSFSGKGVAKNDSEGWGHLMTAAAAGDEGALRRILREAAASNVLAQHAAGEYYNQRGARHSDPVKAFAWYDRAARAGHANARWRLAMLYEEGPPGVSRNVAKAFEHYLHLAGQGDCRAMPKVADMYRKGEGVPADRAEARKWESRARNECS